MYAELEVPSKEEIRRVASVAPIDDKEDDDDDDDDDDEERGGAAYA